MIPFTVTIHFQTSETRCYKTINTHQPLTNFHHPHPNASKIMDKWPMSKSATDTKLPKHSQKLLCITKILGRKRVVHRLTTNCLETKGSTFGI